MTCIAGLVQGGKVYIGGDSAGVAGYSLRVRADVKVFKTGAMIFGFTSSFRMGQLLRYGFKLPDHDPRKTDEEYMVTEFVDAIRTRFKDGGFASKDNEQEIGGSFLCGYHGRLFEIHGDYQVGWHSEQPIAAVGCGQDIALGALYATESLKWKPAKRLTLALEAAEAFSAGVRRPFVIESI